MFLDLKLKRLLKLSQKFRDSTTHCGNSRSAVRTSLLTDESSQNSKRIQFREPFSLTKNIKTCKGGKSIAILQMRVSRIKLFWFNLFIN